MEKEKKPIIDITPEETLKQIQEKIEELKELEKSLDKKTLEINEATKIINEKLPALNENDLIKESLSVKEVLDKEERIPVTIPISELNPQDLVVPVTINGYTYSIKRGEEVLIPRTVKELLSEAKYI